MSLVGRPSPPRTEAASRETTPGIASRARCFLHHLQTEQPLLLFLVLGLGVFLFDAWIHPTTGPDDDIRIVIPSEHVESLRVAERDRSGREPTAAELRALLAPWIEEEALVRHALALGLERGDVIVRRRLAQKVRFLLEDASPLPEPSDAELEAWLAARPEAYGHPATLAFEQVFLSRGKHGDRLGEEAQRRLARLGERPDDFAGAGDPFLSGQTVAPSPVPELERTFGREFVAAIFDLPAGAWHGPVASRFGLHLVRITASEPFRPATLDEVRERVHVDVLAHRREERTREEIRKVVDELEIVLEGIDG
ncbi:MAG: peptidyl-prolyl cis-trans isomerase [Candidatus Binatia bacterium]